MKHLVPLKPAVRVSRKLLAGIAVVCGFDHAAVQERACRMIRDGYHPISEEYVLMEHKKTHQQGHFRRLIFTHQLT